MSDLPPKRLPDTPPAHQLDYAVPKADRPDDQPSDAAGCAQLALGFAASIATGVVGTVLVTLIGGITDNAVLGAIVGPIIALGLLAYLVKAARTRWHWTGFLPGVLIGLGLVLLAVGLCFAMLKW